MGNIKSYKDLDVWQKGIGLVKQIYSVTYNFPKEELYTFLAGAGISMDPPSNVPSARMFVKKLFQYYAPEDEIETLLNLESLRYEFLVEKVQNFFDERVGYTTSLGKQEEIKIFRRKYAEVKKILKDNKEKFKGLAKDYL